jgi:hypothetical protein
MGATTEIEQGKNCEENGRTEKLNNHRCGAMRHKNMKGEDRCANNGEVACSTSIKWLDNKHKWCSLPDGLMFGKSGAPVLSQQGNPDCHKKTDAMLKRGTHQPKHTINQETAEAHKSTWRCKRMRLV